MAYNNKTLIKVIALVALVTLSGGIAYYYVTNSVHTCMQEGSISDYQADRDLQDVVDLFHKDWYWLSNREWDQPRLEYMLETGSPNEYEPNFYGKMQIKVLREKGKLVGFVTYYPKNFYEGIILFLAVNPEFRGKRYGQKLIDYAKQEFKNRGLQVLSLVARVNNQSGRKLYLRAGFAESPEPDGEFYKYSMKIK